jgi:enamine deaminase RidA (YjgF/YER057c/UK114 family)
MNLIDEQEDTMDLKRKDKRRAFLASLAAIAGSVWSAPKLLAKAAAPKRKHHGPMVHNGLIYISGQGANDRGPVQGSTIEDHTRKVMENIRFVVEEGGGTMDRILHLNVFLATLQDYGAMNKVYYSYFPNDGPARCTVAMAGVPGRSRLQINGIAAVAK